jgi:peptidoglycan/LPS O-acetylase OafA/YrhL
MHVGWLGVDIFFVLSGFLITGIILNDRDRPDFWDTFYLRRAFRILPAFAVVFAVTLIVVHIFAPKVDISAGYVFPTFFPG